MVTEHNLGTSIPATDPNAIRAFWQAITQQGEVHEVRVLDTRKNGPNRLFGVHGGFFDSEDDFVAAVSRISPLDAAGVFVGLNPVKPALLARAANRIAPLKTAAADTDVTRRRNLLIDVTLCGRLESAPQMKSAGRRLPYAMRCTASWMIWASQHRP